jgi:hypothetical protein
MPRRRESGSAGSAAARLHQEAPTMTIALPQEIEARLEDLVKRNGRTRDFYVVERSA